MNGFVDNIAAFVDRVGLEAAKAAPGVVLGFGMTQFDSTDDRDAALEALVSTRR